MNHTICRNWNVGIVVLAAVLLTPQAYSGEIIFRVPDDFPTIQDALDLAFPDLIIEVADGVYTGERNTNLDFHGMPTILRSASGDPEQCIIDCQWNGRGFFFHSGEGTDTVVDGFTIMNGAIWTGEGGGAVLCHGSSPMLSNCRFINNDAPGYGGAIGAESSNLVILNTDFQENMSNYGGAISSVSSTVLLVNCVLCGNITSDGMGGGIFNSGSCLHAINCTICGNATDVGGGGVANEHSTSYLTNCILWGNYFRHWRNTTPSQICNRESSTAIVTYSDIQGGWAGPGNIDSDPLFIDPDGIDDDPSTAIDNDYHLASGSPCIDAGDNTAIAGYEQDLDGNPRLVDNPHVVDTGYGTPPIVDMGAYEYQIPSNDCCSGAIELCCQSDRTGTTCDATSTTTVFCGGLMPRNEVWYFVIGTGRDTILSTRSDVPMKIAIYQNDCDDLSCVCFSEFNQVVSGQYVNELSFCPETLVRYSIAVWCEDTACDFRISVACGDSCMVGACCVPNGDCVELPQNECILNAGEWKGEGVACDEYLCNPADCGDADLDGDVDLADFALFQRCVTQDARFRLDSLDCDIDGDIDLDDYALFQRNWKGPVL